MILLDTHAWIWWVTGSPKLSKKAQTAIDEAPVKLIPAISVWETAMLVAKDRLGLDRDVETWVSQALKLPGVELAGLSPSISVRATRLPGTFHGDPADRMIAATAMEYGVPLVTKDQELTAYRHVETIW
ncbi:MAG: type II toxin-antitoxin system VapC family toxin [Deltaproteobacteria bacterium]|nr:type II toxin-antitoxin system VapC family toxin [Deltaproteobacteria bacterium]